MPCRPFALQLAVQANATAEATDLTDSHAVHTQKPLLGGATQRCSQNTGHHADGAKSQNQGSAAMDSTIGVLIAVPFSSQDSRGRQVAPPRARKDLQSQATALKWCRHAQTQVRTPACQRRQRGSHASNAQSSRTAVRAHSSVSATHQSCNSTDASLVCMNTVSLRPANM